ncbi:MAG: hypothetical protein GYA82_03185 [Synergistaceae bacterium]|nr:hypothetical protein [Synergistaceae bacterium]
MREIRNAPADELMVPLTMLGDGMVLTAMMPGVPVQSEYLVGTVPSLGEVIEELWTATGAPATAGRDESALAPDRVTVVFQVNGKVREQVELPAGMTLDEMQQAVLEADAVKRRLADKEIVRVIAVPDKLVNVVVKGQA